MGAERDFNEAIYLYKWQSHYEEIKSGQKPDTEEFLDFMEGYNYYLEQHYDKIVNCLISKKLNFKNYNQEFLEGQRDYITKLNWLFIRYMYEEKGINFQISDSIWQETLSFLLRDMVLEELINVEDIFIIDKEKFTSYLKGMTSFLSDNFERQFLLLWGIVYIYEFLYEQGIIPDIVYRSALKIVEWIKPDVLSANSNRLWKCSFIHRWSKPDSIEQEIFDNEKELFIKTFSTKLNSSDIENIFSSDINQDKPVCDKNSLNIGRNDPCICGSGRKYKKCCLRLMEKQEREYKRYGDVERNLIWTVDEIAEMSTEEIINKLFYFGIYFNKDVFVNRVIEGNSVEDIVNTWFEKFDIRAIYFDRNFLKLAAEILKNRFTD